MHCLSQVLLIHYKRFKPVKQGNQIISVKLQHPIEAKPELYIKGQKYDLVGVLVHQGESANSGHYYFDTVCPPYTTTLRAYRSNNDDMPELISMEALIDDVNHAYMLAYQKAAEPPPEQPAAASVPPPPERIPSQQKSDEVADSTSETATQEENEFKAKIAERDAILSIPNAMRSHWQHTRYSSLKKSIAKDKDKFPHIPVGMPAMTPAEKKAAQRKRKSDAEREEEREANRARMATPEAKDATRARMATDKNKEQARTRMATDKNKEETRARLASDKNKEQTRARMATDENKEKTRARMATDKNKEQTRGRMATDKNKAKDTARKATDENKKKTRARLATAEYKAANLQQKTAKKAGMTVKAKDAMKTELILSGKFGVELNSLGAMDKVSHLPCTFTTSIIDMKNQVCEHCGARHFEKETGTRMCCVGGKVTLPCFKKPADALLRLLFKDDFNARTFRKFVRSFNNALCLSSLRFNERSFRSNYKPSVVIEGRVHQFFGPLLEKEQETPRFAQLWVHDPAMETTSRIANMSLPASITEAEAIAVREIIETLQVTQNCMN